MQISLTSIKKNITKLLHRYHFILFVIVVMGGLSGAIFLLNNVLVVSDDAGGYTSQLNKESFDTETIEKLKELRASDEQTAKLDFQNGKRIDPFVE